MGPHEPTGGNKNAPGLPILMDPPRNSNSFMRNAEEAEKSAPQGSFLQGLGDAVSRFFTANSVQDLKSKFKDGGITKRVVLIVGVICTTVSRLTAFAIASAAGFAITLAISASLIGLLYILINKDAVRSIINVSAIIGIGVAAIPGYMGAACFNYALESNNHSIEDTFNEIAKLNKFFADLGGAIGPIVALCLANFLKNAS